MDIDLLFLVALHFVFHSESASFAYAIFRGYKNGEKILAAFLIGILPAVIIGLSLQEDFALFLDISSPIQLLDGRRVYSVSSLPSCLQSSCLCLQQDCFSFEFAPFLTTFVSGEELFLVDRHASCDRVSSWLIFHPRLTVLALQPVVGCGSLRFLLLNESE